MLINDKKKTVTYIKGVCLSNGMFYGLHAAFQVI